MKSKLTIGFVLFLFALCDIVSAQETELLWPQLKALKAVDPKNKPMEYKTDEIKGRKVLSADKSVLTLLGEQRYEPNSEISFCCRFFAPQDKKCSISVYTAIKNLPDSKKPIKFECSYTGGEDQLNWQIYAPHDKTTPNWGKGSYYINKSNQLSLSWSEDLRKIIEDQLASIVPVEERWFVFRCQLLQKSYRIYMNDRLLLEQDGLDASGLIKIDITPYIQLASVKTSSINLYNNFEIISLNSNLNSASINGSEVCRETLPNKGQAGLINEIPFIFPSVDEHGNDHIDLGYSWFCGCHMTGRVDPHKGVFNGRWYGALSENQSRIQFRMPEGPYRAIHLIAAADDGNDCTSTLTAQFYRPAAGFPQNISTRVPLFSVKSKAIKSFPIKLKNGKTGWLYLVTIPVDPGIFESFKDMDFVEMELTKEVQLYRAYPDALYYSFHQAGLPSSVHVYALTMERPRVEMNVQADTYAHVWTAPQEPSYTVELCSKDMKARRVTVEMTTNSYNGTEKFNSKKTVQILPNGEGTKIQFKLSPKEYGYHDGVVKLSDGKQVWNEKISFAYLHSDTRERGNWNIGRGPFFGSWSWQGEHYTPSSANEITITGLAGSEGFYGHYDVPDREVLEKTMEKFGMVSLKHFSRMDYSYAKRLMADLEKMPREDAIAKFVDGVAKTEIKPSKITLPLYMAFFPEPHIGMISSGSLPEYWGDAPYELTKEEREHFQKYLDAFLAGAPEIKKRWPDVKILIPHGDPMFTVFCLRESEEAKKYIDGVAVDIPLFERLPEQQTHQGTLHRLWQCKEEYRKAGKPDILMPMYEGPALPDRPGALTAKEMCDFTVRDTMILIAYGVNQLTGGFGAFQSGDYWGEQHYGSGFLERIPIVRPKPVYAAYATLTRHLNRRNFEGWLPTGSLSVYVVKFKHYKDDSLVHVIWTIRGTRPVTLHVPKGTTATVYDLMDNNKTISERNGKITLQASASPQFIEGLSESPRITLGEPDHSDAKPSDNALCLSNIGNNSWKLSEQEDTMYANNNYYQMKRFPGKMSVSIVSASKEQGSKAMAIHLGKQDKERKIMPYYTSLIPEKPVVIPGKSSHIGIWVKAASDWGRVVYELHDAKGERWLSIGTRQSWNCDDMYNWSSFCFDGWRYLRFEMPSHSPYDSFSEKGMTWWGSFGNGDGIIDLPLSLTKIIVERRNDVMYVNDLQPARSDDVLLGDIYAEYAKNSDKTEETVRLCSLRMPVPEGAADIGNPINNMRNSGVGEPIKITGIRLPEQFADGTQCRVYFEKISSAQSYEIWASPYQDGRGALKLGQNWQNDGELVGGLKPDTDFYLFIVYTDKNGNLSKPSEPYKINLKDVFGMK
jgi:hypothetical protein